MDRSLREGYWPWSEQVAISLAACDCSSGSYTLKPFPLRQYPESPSSKHLPDGWVEDEDNGRAGTWLSPAALCFTCSSHWRIIIGPCYSALHTTEGKSSLGLVRMLKYPLEKSWFFWLWAHSSVRQGSSLYFIMLWQNCIDRLDTGGQEGNARVLHCFSLCCRKRSLKITASNSSAYEILSVTHNSNEERWSDIPHQQRCNFLARIKHFPILSHMLTTAVSAREKAGTPSNIYNAVERIPIPLQLTDSHLGAGILLILGLLQLQLQCNV